MRVDWSGIISATIGALGLLGGAIFAWSGNRAVQRAEAESSPYEALAKRVGELEKSDALKHEEIRKLRRTVDGRDDVIRDLVEFVDELGAWLHRGQSGKAPRPSSGLHDYIRASYWQTDPDGIPPVPDDGQPFDPSR